MKKQYTVHKKAGFGFRAILAAVFLMGSFAERASAQWQTVSYALKGGWNSIYLHGDAGYAPIESLFPNAGATAVIQEVWRWNPNPDQVQFTDSPLIPATGTPEWSVWIRGGVANTLNTLNGQTAYLVKCSGAGTTSHPAVTIKQSPRLPGNTWVRNGANFLGFPAFWNGNSYPLFSNYFATFPAAIAANARVFRYVGGDLGAGNPLQIFSPATERLDATQAYWFSAEVVGNFSSPLSISLSTADGMDFGRNGSIITARLMNRSAAAMTVTISPVASSSAPAGQEDLSGSTNNVGLPTGNVPVTRRAFDAGTGQWVETLISSSYTQAIGPGGSVELSFGIDRTAMTAASPGALYASLLRMTDNMLYDILVPVRARKTSLSGLWVGDALVKAVESKPAADAVTASARPYPLRYILHVADDGTARVLSQVYLGRLSTPGNNFGVCTKEAGLLGTEKAKAARICAVHLPLDRVLDGSVGSGSVAVPGTLSRSISLPFDDPTNPFVHKYHPDHDNKDPRGQPLSAGKESYSVTREVTFTFTSTPPPGSTVTSGWGSTVIGGNYAEVIHGLHKDSAGVGAGNGLNIKGTFELRRISELGSISINP